MEQLISATQRYYTKALDVLGAADWRTREAGAELRRYRKISAMPPEQQREYWKARSSLRWAQSIYVRGLRDGRFTPTVLSEIENGLHDAIDEIKGTGVTGPSVVEAYLTLGEICCMGQEYGSASTWVAKAQEALRNCEAGEVYSAASHECMGVILCAQNRYDEATVQFEKALLIRRRWYGTTTASNYAACLVNLAFARVHQERFVEAEAYCEQARVVFQSQGESGLFSGKALCGKTARTCYEYCMAAVHVAFGEHQGAELYRPVLEDELPQRLEHPKPECGRTETD